MADPYKFAVIPTNGRACLKDCLAAIQPQVDCTILVYTTLPVRTDLDLLATYVYPDVEQPPNISRWWNKGLDAVADMMEGADRAWDVAIINDDVIVPPGWFQAVSAGMRTWDAGAACSGAPTERPVRHLASGPVPLSTRLTGYAFMLPGEKGLRLDERFVWWFGDDDLGWRAADNGGMVMVAGYHVQHLYPNGQMTPEFHAQTGIDAQSFVDKWGQRPW